MESRAPTPPWLLEGKRWCTKLMCQTSCAKSGVQNSACRPGVQSLVCKHPIPTRKTQRAKPLCKNPVCKSQHAKPLCKTLRAEPGRTQRARSKPVCKARPRAAIAASPARPIFAALRTRYRRSVAEPRTALLSSKRTLGNHFPPLRQSSVSGRAVTTSPKTQRNAQRQISDSCWVRTGIMNFLHIKY